MNLMSNFLCNLKSKSFLLVILLVSIFLYSSVNFSAGYQTSSSKKTFTAIAVTPTIVLESFASEDKTHGLNRLSLNEVAATPLCSVFLVTIFDQLDSFAFIKLPLHYFLFDLPPPFLA